MEAAELEELIFKVASCDSSREDLLKKLLHCKVAVMLNKGLENGALAIDARPLSLTADHAFQVLATFTSVQKSTPWVEREPAYGHVLYTNFAWAAGIIPSGVGLAINPGYKWSFLIPLSELRALADSQAAI